MRVRAIAPKRSSVAGNTPPSKRSQTSVVVMSITPAIASKSTSFSIDWPPTPVAWKTRHSKSSSNAPVMASTQGVVTPNMVSPIAGFTLPRRSGTRSRSFVLAARAFTMPTMAAAPLASTWRVTELRPATSVTE